MLPTFNHFRFSWIVFVLAGLGILLYLPLSDSDLSIFLSKVFNAGCVLVLGTLFTRYFHTKSYNVDDTIFRNPVALSVYVGCVFLAIAIVFSAN